MTSQPQGVDVPRRPTCVSLFTGAGGFDVGLRAAGFDVVFATDAEPLCEATYRHPDNFGPSAVFHVGNVSGVTRALIERATGSTLDDLDLLVGGPPCPPYSKSRFHLKDKPRDTDDPMGDETLTGYLRLLEELDPKAFIFENVAGFTFKTHPNGFQRLTETARRLGYDISYSVLNAADYGVPQIRQRFIMVGLKGRRFEFPSPTHADPADRSNGFVEDELPLWRTAGEAFQGLDEVGSPAGGKYHDLLVQVPPGDNYLFHTAERGHPNPSFKWRSRYWSFLLKLSPDKPSWTIQAQRSGNTGPFHWDSRDLSIAEIKRLQTFPDGWFLAGNAGQRWRQVGNAVPPLLAEHLGKAVLKALS